MDNQLSPNPIVDGVVVEETMSFPQAIAEVIKGQKIARKSWSDKSSFGALMEGWLMIYIHEGFHKWLINDGDLEATDWLVIHSN